MEKDYFFNLLNKAKTNSQTNYSIFESFSFSEDSTFEAYCESNKGLYFLFSNNDNENIRNLFRFTSEGLEYVVYDRATNKGSHFHVGSTSGSSIKKENIINLISGLKPTAFFNNKVESEKTILEEILHESRIRELSPMPVNEHKTYSNSLN